MSQGKIVLMVVGVVGALVAFAAVMFAIQWFSAPARGALQAREQIQSGANRITQYNKFFNVCADIQAKEDAIRIMDRSLSTAAVDDHERILINITALQTLRVKAIRQYNADAAKSYTNGQFRASDLPYEIKVEGETECVNVY